MVVVVPSFTERDQGDQKIVATVIFGMETSSPEYVRQRVDYKCSVIDEDRTYQEAPHQHLSGGSVHSGIDDPQQSSQRQHEEG